MQKTKKSPTKISKLAKAWRALAKDKKNYEKAMNFYEAFLNAQFWIKLDDSEEENFGKYKKRGIKANEKIDVSLSKTGSILLFEARKELEKEVAKNYKKGEKITIATIRQHGGEIIYSFGKKTTYAIKIKEVRDFVYIYPENVTFIKKNFHQ